MSEKPSLPRVSKGKVAKTKHRKNKDSIFVVNSDSNISKGRQEWSNYDLENLLILLENYGLREVNDNDFLKKMLPGKTTDSLRTYLATITATSRHVENENVLKWDQKQEKTSVYKWLEKLLLKGSEADKANILPQALHFIAKFENHSLPEESQGVDFAEIYRYLADLSIGLVPKGLNRESAKLIVELCQDLALKVETIQDQMRSDIKNISKVRTWDCNTYPRITREVPPSEEEIREVSSLAKETQEDIMLKFLSEPALNPFGLKPETLMKPFLLLNSHACQADKNSGDGSNSYTQFK
ncbi:uncharacterized protein LOC136039098 [Artemia franciscana]|uniref:uncharacterized protein LOC136039098 n=1 Tax=Artemia franciscana TaxID=6661 RepID=UPI0032DA63BB